MGDGEERVGELVMASAGSTSLCEQEENWVRNEHCIMHTLEAQAQFQIPPLSPNSNLLKF